MYVCMYVLHADCTASFVSLCDSGRFENFESDHKYESNVKSDVRFEIESNHEASQVPKYNSLIVVPLELHLTTSELRSHQEPEGTLPELLSGNGIVMFDTCTII